jgi:hypothetical protein
MITGTSGSSLESVYVSFEIAAFCRRRAISARTADPFPLITDYWNFARRSAAVIDNHAGGTRPVRVSARCLFARWSLPRHLGGQEQIRDTRVWRFGGDVGLASCTRNGVSFPGLHSNPLRVSIVDKGGHS